ncbi:pro-resilin-like [Topomyia yanbarensis]|uniref:pro-resilin-like n=1 Tax=Topomyia yanbarensis TaxID=2498891 RepID=UPI00273CB5A7|nr:pro-resilin-like [Topomyia yanbarensis]
MKIFAAVAVISLAVLAAAEPPAPRSNYLPPNQQQAGNFNGANGYNYNTNNNGYNYPSTAPSAQYGAPSGSGTSGSEGYNYADANAEPAKYSFEYNVQDSYSGNDFGHMESRDGDRTVGRYYVLLPDGRKQIVNYEADQNGYRPTITYEDTGAGSNGSGGYPNSQGGFQGYQ